MKTIKYFKELPEKEVVTVVEAPVLSDKRRVEKILFKFDNPGDVEIEVPVITCERTQQKFFHPDDVDTILTELEKEYKRVHKKLKR
jgi:hypothetical protein